jgi:hypothetical protein
MFRKIRFVLLGAALVVVGSSSGGFGGVIGWFALVYVLWRATPAVVQDIRRLYSGAGGSAGLFGRRRGARANSTL